MKVISTNICKEPKSFIWNGKEEKTGIFKYPTLEALYLTKSDVEKDTIINRINHGGENKACYLFSADEYTFWKKRYPQLEWDWGMFGENLTLDRLEESEIRVGNIYKIGGAMVQISQPREPCYKLGIRFGNQKILREFIARNRPGTYVKILEEGKVLKGDTCQLVTLSKNTLTVQEFYSLMFLKEKPRELLHRFMENPAVPQYKKDRFKKYLK